MKEAGLLTDWLGVVKPRLVALNLRVPGYRNYQGIAGVGEGFDWREMMVLRAFAVAFAPDLIDPMAEQTASGVEANW